MHLLSKTPYCLLMRTVMKSGLIILICKRLDLPEETVDCSPSTWREERESNVDTWAVCEGVGGADREEPVEPWVPEARLVSTLLLMDPLVENGGDLGEPAGVVGEVWWFWSCESNTWSRNHSTLTYTRINLCLCPAEWRWNKTSAHTRHVTLYSISEKK